MDDDGKIESIVVFGANDEVIATVYVGTLQRQKTESRSEQQKAHCSSSGLFVMDSLHYGGDIQEPGFWLRPLGVSVG